MNFSLQCAKIKEIHRIVPLSDENGAERRGVMDGTVVKLCDLDSLVIPAELLQTRVEEQEIDEEVQRLTLRFAAESDAETVQTGDTVYARANRESYPDQRTILLFVGRGLPGAEQAETAVLSHAVGDALTVPLAGKTAVLTITRIVHRTPAAIDDALIASLGIDGVQTVADYRAHVRAKIEADRQMENKKAMVRALLEQLEENSTFAYDEAEMEAYVAGLRAQYANEEGFADESPEEFKQAVLSQAKQDWIADAVCKSRGVTFDEADFAAQADQMREMMELTGEPVPDRAELLDYARRGAALDVLFNAIVEIIVRKAGAEYGNS